MNTYNGDGGKSGSVPRKGREGLRSAARRNEGKAKDEDIRHSKKAKATEPVAAKAAVNNDNNSDFVLGPPTDPGKLRPAKTQGKKVGLDKELSVAQAKQVEAENEQLEALKNLAKEETSAPTYNSSDEEGMVMKAEFVALARYMGIYEACYEGSYDTIALKENPKMLMPDHPLAFKHQTGPLTANQVACIIQKASLNNFSVENTGWTHGSMGRGPNKYGDDCDLACSAFGVRHFERMKREGRSIASYHEKVANKYGSKLPEIAFTSGLVELYNWKGELVTQDEYKKNHKGVRSFVVRDEETHYRLQTKLGFTGDKKGRQSLFDSLTNSHKQLQFVWERFDEQGIMPMGRGQHKKYGERWRNASIRYTIADGEKYFDPYEDLVLHGWVQCDR